MNIKEKLFLFSVLSKNAIFKTKRWYESVRSGKNRLTKDSAYNASLPNHFTPMMEEDRYGDRSDAFDKIISQTHKHFEIHAVVAFMSGSNFSNAFSFPSSH